MKQTVLIVAFVVLASATARAQHPDLAGHWVFNQAQSDNPRDMMQARDSGRRGGGGGGRTFGGRGGFGGRMGGGRRGGQGGGGGGLSDDQRARMRQTMDLVFTAPASLVEGRGRRGRGHQRPLAGERPRCGAERVRGREGQRGLPALERWEATVCYRELRRGAGTEHHVSAHLRSGRMNRVITWFDWHLKGGRAKEPHVVQGTRLVFLRR